MDQINGTIIRHHRLQRMLSLAELAGQVGLGRAQMLKIEDGRGAIDDALIRRLIAVLGIEA